jgi:hypothetical protein
VSSPAQSTTSEQRVSESTPPHILKDVVEGTSRAQRTSKGKNPQIQGHPESEPRMIRKKHDRLAHRWPTTKTKGRYRTIMNALHPWKTIYVCPLPTTWANQFLRTDGRAILDPAPCLIVQERGGQTRTVFATYFRGELLAACDQPGYQESTTIGAGGPRRSGAPPWQCLDDPDPVQRAFDQSPHRMGVVNPPTEEPAE